MVEIADKGGEKENKSIEDVGLIRSNFVTMLMNISIIFIHQHRFVYGLTSVSSFMADVDCPGVS